MPRTSKTVGPLPNNTFPSPGPPGVRPAVKKLDPVGAGGPCGTTLGAGFEWGCEGGPVGCEGVRLAKHPTGRHGADKSRRS